jgi:hypothetical protein
MASGPSQTWVFLVDERFTPQELAALHRAAERWEFALSGQVVIELHQGYAMDVGSMRTSNLILKIPSSVPFIENDRVLAWCQFIGPDQPNIIWMIFDRIKTEKAFENISVHEFGHVFGAVHVGNTLMNPVFDNDLYSCIDQQTAEQAAKALGLDRNLINYCEL